MNTLKWQVARHSWDSILSIPPVSDSLPVVNFHLSMSAPQFCIDSLVCFAEKKGFWLELSF